MVRAVVSARALDPVGDDVGHVQIVVLDAPHHVLMDEVDGDAGWHAHDCDRIAVRTVDLPELFFRAVPVLATEPQVPVVGEQRGGDRRVGCGRVQRCADRPLCLERAAEHSPRASDQAADHPVDDLRWNRNRRIAIAPRVQGVVRQGRHRDAEVRVRCTGGRGSPLDDGHPAAIGRGDGEWVVGEGLV